MFLTAGQPGSLTASYMALTDGELLHGREVKGAKFGNGARGASLLLCAYGPADPASHGIKGRGLLLVWDLSAPTAVPSAAMVRRCKLTLT